jgi:WD40 repeat protein
MQTGHQRGSYPKQDPVHTQKRGKNLGPSSVERAVQSVFGKPKVRNSAHLFQEFICHSKPSAGHAIQDGFIRHRRDVTGVDIDALNETVVTASLDASIIFWSFTLHVVLEKLQVGVCISSLKMQRDNGLIACVCDDFMVRVYDMMTRRVSTYNASRNALHRVRVSLQHIKACLRYSWSDGYVGIHLSW